MRFSRQIAGVLLAGLVVGEAAAQDIVLGNRYRQTPEVLKLYPDLPIPLDTPGLGPDRATSATQTEMLSYLMALATPTAPVVLQTLTVTPQGRAVPVLFFNTERTADPAVLLKTGRPTVWLIGQQHGNEPAGGEAMLAVSKALAQGELRPLLDQLNIIVVPRANPDGAAVNERDNSQRMDLNRDHAAMTLPETRALHHAVQSLPPDLVIDAHEFSVAQRWIEKFGGLQAVDLMMLDATHPMVPAATTKLADDLFKPAIQRAMTEAGLKAFVYHTTSTKRAERAISMGGNAPGIARNAFGLTGAVSLLLETRGVGIGLEGFQRRVATHYLAIRAALQAAAKNATHLKAGVADARRSIAASRRDLIVQYQARSETVGLPLIAPETGERLSVDVAMTNSRNINVLARRARPAGYALIAEHRGGVAELRLLGARTCILSEAVEVDAEMFEIKDRAALDRRAINPDATVSLSLRQVRTVLPAGAVFVPLAQPAGERIAAALEPDAPGSLVALDVIKLQVATSTVPVVRVPVGTPLALTAVESDGAMLCQRAATGAVHSE